MWIHSEIIGKHIPKKIYTTKKGRITCYECNINNEDINHVIAMDNIVNNLRIKCQYSNDISDSNYLGENNEGKIEYGRGNNNNNIINDYDDSKEGISHEFKSNKMKYNNERCHWIGYIKDYDNHLKICKYNYNNIVTFVCQFCKKFIGIISEMKTHYDECKEYIIECPLKCNSEIKRMDIDSHFDNECKLNTLIKCSNNGCNDEVKRSKYDNHVKMECKYAIIECPFRRYGCDINNLMNKDLPNHLESNKMMHYLYKINYDNNNLFTKMNAMDIKLNSLIKSVNAMDKNMNQNKNNINSLQNTFKPKAPNIDLKGYIDSVTLNINNTDTATVDYDIKWAQIPSIIKDKNVKNVISKLYNQHNINWNNTSIPYKKQYQTYKIKNMNCFERYICGVNGKNRHGKSAIKYVIFSPDPFTSDILRDTKNRAILHKILNKQLNKTRVQLRRLYSGKNNGFKAKTFHQFCDNAGPTVSLIQNEFNYIFGGYTSISWKSPPNRQRSSDKSAFLFSILPELKIFPLKYKDDKDAIYISSNFMCAFGKSRDIAIYDECNTTNDNYAAKGSYLDNPNELTGKSQFRVYNIEVFQLYTKN